MWSPTTTVESMFSGCAPACGDITVVKRRFTSPWLNGAGGCNEAWRGYAFVSREQHIAAQPDMADKIDGGEQWLW